MAMGKHKRKLRQQSIWIATQELPRSASHPFYKRLNRILEQNGFDEYVEQLCESFYAPTLGRPSLAPGMYFRVLMLGYFEGIDSERGIAWRAADSLSVREFVGLELGEGVVMAPRGWLFRALSFTITRGKIVQIDVIADPARFRQLDLAVVND